MDRYKNFFEKAIKIHNNKYDYSKVEYVNSRTKVCIICPEHGEFWQTPHNHIGQKQGCPKCNKSHMEKDVSLFLSKNNILYEEQKTFDWLKYKRRLYLDFYLPEYKIAIECQGEQHYNKFRWENNSNNLNERKKRDKTKQELCAEHSITILYYSEKSYSDDIIINKNSLLKEIRKYEKQN